MGGRVVVCLWAHGGGQGRVDTLPHPNFASPAAGGQGSVAPEDVAEACLLAFRLSDNAVPEEICLKALKPSSA